MQMNLTVNKPATTQLAGEAPVGLKIKVEDNQIMLKFTNSDAGRDTFPLFQRTRGGLGVTLKGALVEKLLSIKGMSTDTHMTMEPSRYGWIVATPYAEGKPSKLVPTARFWRTRDEVAQEKAAEPAPKASRAKATPASAKPAAKAKADKPAAKKAAAKPAAKAAPKADAKPAAKPAAKRPAKPKADAKPAQVDTVEAKSDLPMPQAAEQAREQAGAEAATA